MSISNSRSSSVRPPVSSSIAGVKGRRRPRQKFRPDLLALETRALLSTLTVVNDNDHGTGSLRGQLAAAHAGDTINFAPSAYGTINLTSGPLQVATSVNIKGPGAREVTVSGDDQSTVFNVQGGVTATISGLTITDGVSNPAGPGGGGITNYGNLTLSGDTITGNAAVGQFGHSGYSGADGGGVLTEGPLTVTNATIRGNSALAGGGIASLGAPVTITGSTITGNVARSYGGGIETSSGSLTVTGSTITGNSAIGDGGGIDAGMFTESTPGPMTITGLTITGNSGYSGGGIQDFGGPVTIAGSTISGNTAAKFGQGGGINSQGGGLVAVTGSTISNNSAGSRGGIESNGGSVSLTACTISGNTGGAIGIYGLPYFPGPVPTLTVTGSTISGNSAAYYGGGIFAATANVTVSGSVVADNVAQSAAGFSTLGGGIAMLGSFYSPTSKVNALTVTGSTFAHNQAGGGGAIYTGPYASLSVSNSSFVGNTANGVGSADGGAMDLVALLQGTITNSVFTGNQAIGSPSGGNAAGGAIELNSQGGYVPGTLSIQGSTFTGNSAQGGAGGGSGIGGAIDNQADTLKVTGGSIVGNSAIGGSGGGDGEGGGVANSGTASFTGVLISLNAAEAGSGGGSGFGGGLFIATGAITTLKNTPVVGNTASSAGNNIYPS